MSNQGERLQKLIDSLKTNQLRFSRAIGVQVSQTNAVCKGRGEFSRNYLQKVSEKYPTVNTHWLLTGLGDMFLSPESKEKEGIVSESNPTYTKSINLVQISPYNDDEQLRKRLGDNLASLVFAWGMKKYQLFDIIMPGVAKQSITNYLSGSSQVPLYALVRLERITGISIIEWITREIKSWELPPEPTPGIKRQDNVIREIRALLDRVGA